MSTRRAEHASPFGLAGSADKMRGPQRERGMTAPHDSL